MAAPDQTADALVVWDTYAASVCEQRLPLIVFDANCTSMSVFDGAVVEGHPFAPDTPALVVEMPILMSPAYAGFAVQPYEPRVLQFDGCGILFARPSRGKFMAPSIDTILCCVAVRSLFARTPASFSRVLEVGSGSALIGKYAALGLQNNATVTLIDVDPIALEYARTEECALPDQTNAGHRIKWEFAVGDAVKFLDNNHTSFDLVISNPPYIPTRAECTGAGVVGSNFWEGTGLLQRVLTQAGCTRVVCFSSLSLKAEGMRATLASLGERCQVLVEREVAWKAWYAGGSETDHLLSTPAEEANRSQIGVLSLFVGATVTPRQLAVADGRNVDRSLHWHMSYVVVVVGE